MSLMSDFIKGRSQPATGRQVSTVFNDEEEKRKKQRALLAGAPTLTSYVDKTINNPAFKTVPRSNQGMIFNTADGALDNSSAKSRADEELRNSINPARKVDEFTINTAKAAVRAPIRAAVTIARENSGIPLIPPQQSQWVREFAKQKVFEPIKTPYGDEYIARTPIAKFIFGSDPIGTTKQEGEKLAEIGTIGAIKLAELKEGGSLDAEAASEISKDIKKYKWLTIPLGILGVGSDLIPGVGGARKAVSKQVAEQLIKKYGVETANEIIERGGKELAESALKKEGKEFLEEFTISDAKKISENTANSFVKNPEEALKKPNRLAGDKFSFQEARTGIAQNGKNLDNRIVVGRNDAGELILKDGRHLLEAYRVDDLSIPKNKVRLEDGVTFEDFKKVSREGQIPQETPRNLDTPRLQTEANPVSRPADPKVDLTSSKVVNNSDPTIAQINKTVNELAAENRAALKSAAQLDPTEINATKDSVYKRMRASLSEVFTKFREIVENSNIRVKKLQGTKGVITTTDADPTLAKKLFTGRVSERTEDVTTVIKNIDKDIVKTSKTLKIADQKLLDDVNDYLIAKHAPERNKELGDKFAAGISDEQAAGIMARIAASPQGAEVTRIANQVQDLNKQTLQILYDGGVIEKKLYKQLTETYKNHVPLNRVFDDLEDIAGVLNSRGLDVKKTGLNRAKGSTRDIADIMQNVSDNLKSAIIRAEKNQVDNEIAKFAKNNQHLGLFEDIPYFKARKSDEQILFYFENGKHKALRIADPRLAAAMKGVNMQHMPTILKFVSTFTRLYSGLATRFNPEFLIPNKIRDVQEMAVYAASQKNIDFTGATKSVVRDPASIKSIAEFMIGRDTVGARLYKQMRLDGGSIGGIGISTKKANALDLAKIRKNNRSSIRKGLSTTLETIDNANQIIEDSSRLSVYKTALDRGLSRREAARMAKDATIDFNQMGTGGPIINGLYMFSNASIQGSTKMLRAMKNPKVAGTVLLVVGTATTLTNQHNDSIDPDWRDKVPKWDRYNNLVVLLPGSDGINYIKIPVSWGLKPIKVSMDYLYDLGKDKATIPDAIEGILSSTLDAYNPLGGTDTLSTATPSILDIPVEIARNRAWHGGKIKPDYDPSSPEALKYFKTLTETPSGRGFKDITKYFYSKTDGKLDISPADLEYSFQQYIGGLGRFSSKIMTTLNGIGKGELPSVDNTPILSRFVGTKSAEEVGDKLMPSGKFYDIRDAKDKESAWKKSEGKDLYQELKAMSPEDRSNKMKELIQSGNVDAVKGVYDEFKKDSKGLSSIESSFASASVATRAEYLRQVSQELPKDQKMELFARLYGKGLITKAVMEEFMRISK